MPPMLSLLKLPNAAHKAKAAVGVFVADVVADAFVFVFDAVFWSALSSFVAPCFFSFEVSAPADRPVDSVLLPGDHSNWYCLR